MNCFALLTQKIYQVLQQILLELSCNFRYVKLLKPCILTFKNFRYKSPVDIYIVTNEIKLQLGILDLPLKKELQCIQSLQYSLTVADAPNTPAYIVKSCIKN